MKRVFKLVMVVALTLCTTSIFAQKLGCINMQEIIVAMPEMTELQSKMETFSNEFSENLEVMQVEFNNKVNDYQTNSESWSASVRSLKEKDLQDLQARMEQFRNSASQELQYKQNELLQPVILKAQEAVKKISKEGEYAVIYDLSVNSLAYFDEATVTNIADAVKAELGITATPAQ